jgi:zinc protease
MNSLKRITLFRRTLFCLTASVAALCAISTAAAGISERVIRTQVAGVELLMYPMGTKDVVTVVGSLPAGDAHARNGSNPAVATLVGMMLDKGTQKQDKFEIAKQLEGVGTSVWFSVGSQTVSLGGRSLKEHAPTMIRLMAEQLREPAFSADELAKVKTQLQSNLRLQMEDTNFRARHAFAYAIYPAGHPNRPVPTDEWLAAVERATIDELKAFHREHYGPANLRLVFAGDIDPELIRAEVEKAFSGWSGGAAVARTIVRGKTKAPREQTIPLKDKASFSIVMGQATDLRYQDPERLALSVGTAILGSGFSGRLMSTVRDKEGLTYGIGAGVGDDTFVNGSWNISATFAPALLDKGIASTRRELEKWWRQGVTAAELEARKTNLIGSFQVSLATTFGMANAILHSLDSGVGIEWLDRYPDAVKALTVEQVNAAIRKHLDPKKMVLVKAG